MRLPWQTGTLTKSLPAATDLKVANPGAAAAWIEGTDSGWNTANHDSWTFETRLKFTANPNGFILWLGTDTKRILVEIHGDRTRDHTDGGSVFDVAHNNLDGQFHVFRVAHDAANGRYHVWRDGTRLSPLAGVAYDQTATDSRLILGDYTSATFGNNFDVTIDYIRFDQTGAFLPVGADADIDGLPDSWEYHHFGDVTAGIASSDDDGDGRTNLDEYISNTNPRDATSVLKVGSIQKLGGNLVRVTLPTSAQRSYTLWKSGDLGLTDPWAAVAGPALGADGDLVLQDPGAAGPQGFYRVTVSLP